MSVNVLSHYFCLLKFRKCSGAIWDTNSLHRERKRKNRASVEALTDFSVEILIKDVKRVE